MICPYCGAEMEHGTMNSNGNLHFLPDGKKAPLLFSREAYAARGAVLLPPYQDSTTLLHDGSTVAWCCKACQKLLICYENI